MKFVLETYNICWAFEHAFFIKSEIYFQYHDIRYYRRGVQLWRVVTYNTNIGERILFVFDMHNKW